MLWEYKNVKQDPIRTNVVQDTAIPYLLYILYNKGSINFIKWSLLTYNVYIL